MNGNDIKRKICFQTFFSWLIQGWAGPFPAFSILLMSSTLNLIHTSCINSLWCCMQYLKRNLWSFEKAAWGTLPRILLLWIYYQLLFMRSLMPLKWISCVNQFLMRLPTFNPIRKKIILKNLIECEAASKLHQPNTIKKCSVL